MLVSWYGMMSRMDWCGGQTGKDRVGLAGRAENAMRLFRKIYINRIQPAGAVDDKKALV